MKIQYLSAYKGFWIAGLLAGLALIILFYLGKSSLFQQEKTEAIINGKKFKLELVSDDERRGRGLGGRDSICENCGMLFRFPDPGNYSFWMKDMKFSLDIIWISGKEIVHIAKNISPDYPRSINPEISADKVLELNGGTCDKNNIKEGDMVIF